MHTAVRTGCELGHISRRGDTRHQCIVQHADHHPNRLGNACRPLDGRALDRPTDIHRIDDASKHVHAAHRVCGGSTLCGIGQIGLAHPDHVSQCQLARHLGLRLQLAFEVRHISHNDCPAIHEALSEEGFMG
jgi:hypothetical protein